MTKAGNPRGAVHVQIGAMDFELDAVPGLLISELVPWFIAG